MHLGTHHGCGCIEQHTHFAHAAVGHGLGGGFVIAAALQRRDQALEAVLLVKIDQAFLIRRLHLDAV